MERDMDLVRKILMVIVEHPHGYAPEDVTIEGYSQEAIGFHIFLMGQDQGGLLHVLDSATFGDASPRAIAAYITWKGYEFVDTVRNETVWTKVKGIVQQKGGSISFEILKELAIQTSKSYLLYP
jgi:hypothetical protein